MSDAPDYIKEQLIHHDKVLEAIGVDLYRLSCQIQELHNQLTSVVKLMYRYKWVIDGEPPPGKERDAKAVN